MIKNNTMPLYLWLLGVSGILGIVVFWLTFNYHPVRTAESIRKRLVYAPPNAIDFAIDNYTKAIAVNPKDAQAYYGRGQCYFMKHESDKAQADISKAEKLGIFISPELREQLKKVLDR